MNDTLTRRNFLKCAGMTCAGTVLFSGAVFPAPIKSEGIAQGPLIRDVLSTLEAGAYANVNPVIRSDILENPRGVFIIRTGVKAEKDANGSFDSAGPQLEEAGHQVASALFEKGTEKGGQVAINPNWTFIPANLRYPTIGVTVAPQFIAGFAEGMKEMGGTNIVVSERSAGADMLREAGHLDIIGGHGIKFIDGSYNKFSDYTKNELTWFKIKDGQVWKRVPVIRPHFDRESLTINMPKLKNHNLGLTTLSIKNMQGYVPTGYGHYCDQWHQLYTIRPEMRDDLRDDFWQNIERSFLKHLREGYKYWDYEQSYRLYQERGGWEKFKEVRKDRKRADEFMKGVKNLMWDEMWGQRTMDSLSALKPSINIVEGVIGRDGDAFANGSDYLTNYVVAGLDPVAVDAVASWIMGQNPEELYYLRLAGERGYGPIDVNRIPIFLVDGKTITAVKEVKSLERQKLGVYFHSDLKGGLKFF